MTEVVECIACSYGNHAEHVAAVPPLSRMLGGSECPCKGECRGRPQEPVVLGPPWHGVPVLDGNCCTGCKHPCVDCTEV